MLAAESHDLRPSETLRKGVSGLRSPTITVVSLLVWDGLGGGRFVLVKVDRIENCYFLLKEPKLEFLLGKILLTQCPHASHSRH